MKFDSNIVKTLDTNTTIHVPHEKFLELIRREAEDIELYNAITGSTIQSIAIIDKDIRIITSKLENI